MNLFTRGDRRKFGDQDFLRETERLLDWLIDLVQQWREKKLCRFSEIFDL
jgi:hypothetical protein